LHEASHTFEVPAIHCLSVIEWEQLLLTITINARNLNNEVNCGSHHTIIHVVGTKTHATQNVSSRSSRQEEHCPAFRKSVSTSHSSFHDKIAKLIAADQDKWVAIIAELMTIRSEAPQKTACSWFKQSCRSFSSALRDSFLSFKT
jgi:hypothetical protein